MDIPHSPKIDPAIRSVYPDFKGSGMVCPYCGNPASITGSALVCGDLDCGWHSGNALDFLLAHRGESGLDSFSLIYRDLHPTDEDLFQYLRHRSDMVLLRRCFQKLMNRKEYGNRGLLAGAGLMRKHYGEYYTLGRSGALVTSKELRKLLSFCRRFKDIPMRNLKGLSYLVVPVFGDYHTISGFLYGRPGESLEYQSFIDTYKVGYIGLWNFNPNDVAHVSSSVVGLIRGQQSSLYPLMLEGEEVSNPGVDFGGRTFHMDSISSLAAFHHANLNQAGPHAGLINRIVREVEAGADVITIARSTRLLDSWKKLLVTALLERGLKEEAISIQQSFDNEDRYESRIGNIFISSADGYHMIPKKEPDRPVQITNFTLQVTEFVHCAESGDNFSIMKSRHADKEEEVLISDRNLEKPREIEKHVQSKFTEGSGISNPTVFEPTLMKQMLPWFNKQRSEATYCRGVDTLGWTSDGSGFTAPGWYVDYEGVKNSTPQRPNPNHMPLENFDFNSHPTGDSLSPSTAYEVINLAVGFVARVFSGRPVRAIPIKNTEHSATFLSRLFLGLGQLNPIQVSVNGRNNHHDIFRGFPFYGRGTTAVATRDIKNSAFILSDEGINLPEYPSDWEEVRYTFVTVLQEVSDWIMTTRGIKLKTFKAASLERELEREGIYYIRDCLKHREWPATGRKFNNLESFLESLSTESVREWFKHDLESQKVFIKKGDLDIEKDLRDLCVEYKSSKKHHEVDALSASWMLEHYFGESPAMAVNLNVG